VVESIAGQSRFSAVFTGAANHAGATPMRCRRDALAAAAEWISAVEREACGAADLVATVGKIEAHPGAANVIPGEVRATLDVRHSHNATRHSAVDRMLALGTQIASRRSVAFSSHCLMDQSAVPMLLSGLDRAVEASGYPLHRMTSGAGHDAMILARKVPAAMLFLRSPGGISHHPAESVLPEDVDAALAVGERFLESWRPA